MTVGLVLTVMKGHAEGDLDNLTRYVSFRVGAEGEMGLQRGKEAARARGTSQIATSYIALPRPIAARRGRSANWAVHIWGNCPPAGLGPVIEAYIDVQKP